MRKNDKFTYFSMLILCIWLQVVNKVKFTHQGESYIKVKVKICSTFQFYAIMPSLPMYLLKKMFKWLL